MIKERAARLRGLGQSKREFFYRSCLGKEFLVLAEGRESHDGMAMKGMTDNYLPVVFSSTQNLKNHLVPVVLDCIEKGKVVGTMADES